MFFKNYIKNHNRNLISGNVFTNDYKQYIRLTNSGILYEQTTGIKITLKLINQKCLHVFKNNTKIITQT